MFPENQQLMQIWGTTVVHFQRQIKDLLSVGLPVALSAYPIVLHTLNLRVPTFAVTEIVFRNGIHAYIAPLSNKVLIWPSQPQGYVKPVSYLTAPYLTKHGDAAESAPSMPFCKQMYF